MNELIKYALTLGVKHDNDLYNALTVFYSNFNASDVETFIFTLQDDMIKYLVNKGFIFSNGEILKVSESRLNENLNVNVIQSIISLFA